MENVKKICIPCDVKGMLGMCVCEVVYDMREKM